MEKESCWVSPVSNRTVAFRSYRPGSTRSGRRKLTAMRSCCPVLHADAAAAPDCCAAPERPLAVASHRFAGIVDDDDLLLDGLAGSEVVILAGEVFGLAADVGQQRPVVAQQGLPVGRRHPVRAFIGHVHPFVRVHRCSRD